MKTLRFLTIAVISVLFILPTSTTIAQQPAESPAQPYLQALSVKPDGIDLDVTYINRTPLYSRYSVLYTSDLRPFLYPGTENDQRWPASGEVVTFTAHIVNKGTTDSDDFAFKWFVDGAEVAAGTHSSLSPTEEATESYEWAWAHTSDGEKLLGEHSIRFEVDPEGAISETYETNNYIEDRTDALSLALALTPELYAALETPINSDWPFSAEDWLQKQIAAMNAAFARSMSPSIPNGIAERVRLDQILIADSQPPADLSRDGLFFMAADDRQGNPYYDAANDVSGGLIHELMHQLGVIDLYNLDVVLEIPQVMDQRGQPVQMEYSPGALLPGLMSNPGIQPPTLDEHTALALNANKGYRRGYYGEYLFDVSDQVYLQVLDNEGQPAPDVTVKLYQRSSDFGSYGGQSGTIDNTPEITGVTDQDGILLLPNRSMGSPTGTAGSTNTGHVLHDNPFGLINIIGNNNEFMLELTRGDHQEFGWLDITAFNLAMWRGDRIVSTLEIASHVPPSGTPAPPTNLTAIQEYGLVNLQWSGSSSPGVTGYNIYRTEYSISAYQRIGTRITDLSYSDVYDPASKAAIYVVTAVDSQGRESGFSNPFYAFRLLHPMGLVVDDQNNRIVLDPQNGYSLLAQREDGTIFDTRESIHHHLEYSEYLARDREGNLILSHPGDFYSSRHSIRVTNKDIVPLVEFGERGSGDGQFETPAGLDVWGDTCGKSGPYNVDAHTLLLLHFDNSFEGAQGEVASLQGVSLTGGKFAQAAAFDSTDFLSYPTAGNLNRTEGAIELWIRPHWNGGDNQSYTFFETGNSWFNRMRIMKDGANNLRFMVWDSATEYGIAQNISYWQPGEWHRVVAAWTGTTMNLFVDNTLVASSDTANPPDVLAPALFIGSSWDLHQQANADIDEFRISDVPRASGSDSCQYRILVADSGNNRIQAFDAQGNFIAAYGSSNSTGDPFNNPQGLAVNENGDVFVVDSGNNRLHVLSFDGFRFEHIRSIAAGFGQPTGVAAYGANHIIVADTGNNKIKVLDAQGHLLKVYTAPNDGRTGEFNGPRGVAVDQNSAIIVADTGSQRVVSILDALSDLTTKVTIDIRPGILQNTIVLGKLRVIPVAILSTPDFDARLIDKSSLTFGRTGDEGSLIMCIRGVDVNHDRLLDTLCFFRARHAGFQVGDSEGILRGQTRDGIPIEGRDQVKVREVGQ